jgi:tetratricopeptide (TPR) repeat protein
MTAQVQVQHGGMGGLTDWLNRYVLIAVIGVGVMAMYAIIHLPRLAPSSARNVVESITIVADTITVFYVFFFVLTIALAAVLMHEAPLPMMSLREQFFMIFYLILAVAAVVVVKTTNLDSIRADIFYKQGLNFDGQRQWDGSIAMYREALNLAPDQDFYYLFYGRAYLEKAKTVADAKQREDLLVTSRTQLLRARDLNPLNTDHSANLARLYRTWAEVTSEPVTRTQLLNESIKYYDQAEVLSPHNAQIYNEFGSVYAMLGQTDNALNQYKESVAIDSEFSQTYLLLGDLYLGKNDYDNAASAYQQALKYDPTVLQAHSALGLVYSRQNKYDLAISENLIVLSKQPTDLSSLRNVALLYQQTGMLPEALSYAQRALAVASDQDKPALSAFIAQLQAQMQTPK